MFKWNNESLKGIAKGLYCQYVLPGHQRMKWYSNLKNKTPLKKIIALQRLEDEKFTKREQLINFEWKIEALKRDR
jgi:hypothetical protein